MAGCVWLAIGGSPFGTLNSNRSSNPAAFSELTFSAASELFSFCSFEQRVVVSIHVLQREKSIAMRKTAVRRAEHRKQRIEIRCDVIADLGSRLKNGMTETGRRKE